MLACNSIRNCFTVFQYDPVLSSAIAKNLLTERKDLIKPIRKRRNFGKTVTDTDMKYIRLYLEKNYNLTSEKKILAYLDKEHLRYRNRYFHRGE